MFSGVRSLRLRHRRLRYWWFVFSNETSLSFHLKNIFNTLFSPLFLGHLTQYQHNQDVAENKLSDQIIALLEHYKQKDPLGMPGKLVADPFPVPDSEQSLPMGSTLTTTDALAHGLSKFRIKNIALDVYQMLVRLNVCFKIHPDSISIDSFRSPIRWKLKLNSTKCALLATTPYHRCFRQPKVHFSWHWSTLWPLEMHRSLSKLME